MMTNKRVTRATMWAALLGMGLWAGCSFVGDAPDEGTDSAAEQSEQSMESVAPTQVGEIIYFDDAFQIDEALLGHATTEDRILRIPASRAGEVMQREVGEIIYNHESEWFAMRITGIEREGDEVVVHGEPVRATEVIKFGQFEVQFSTAPELLDEHIVDVGRTGDFSEELDQRRQALSRSWDAQIFNYEVEFANQEVLEGSGGSAELNMGGGLYVDAGVSAVVTLSLGSVTATVEISGSATVQAEWSLDIEASWSYSNSFTLPIEDFVTFELLGMNFSIEPYISGSVNASASGFGHFSQEMRAEGEVGAGVTSTVSVGGGVDVGPYLRSDFATHHDINIDAGAEAAVELGFESGIVLYESGNEMARAVPLDAHFQGSAHANLLPECYWQASIGIDSRAEISDPIQRDWSHSWWGFQRRGNFEQIPGCMSDEDPPQCTTDSDCATGLGGARSECNTSTGVCQPAADMVVSLQWQPDINLNLHVLTPEGTVYSNNNTGPTPAGRGQMFQSSCGNCMENQSFGHEEIFIFDGLSSGDQFYIWVENTDGYHEHSTQDSRLVNYGLSVDHRGVFSESYSGEMSSDAGTKSIQYRYRVP